MTPDAGSQFFANQEQRRPAIARIPSLELPRSSNFNEENIIRGLLRQIPLSHGYCVDIGASDGQTMSNTHFLFQCGWEGLAVEMDPAKYAILSSTYARFSGARTCQSCVTPDNVLDLLAAHAVPRDFGFLNLDIDGYDYFVLDQLLSAYQPSIICAEINEKIPPPIRFTVKWDPKYVWATDHFYGQSLSMLMTLAGRRGYDLVDLEYNSAFLVRGQTNPLPALTAESAYQKGYALRPDRLQRLPWNQNMEPLQSMGAAQGREFLRNFFQKYEGAFILE